MARAKQKGAQGHDEVEDCAVPGTPQVKTCRDFYEWNARAQLTTWAGGYAVKHWNGLIHGQGTAPLHPRVLLLPCVGSPHPPPRRPLRSDSTSSAMVA